MFLPPLLLAAGSPYMCGSSVAMLLVAASGQQWLHSACHSLASIFDKRVLSHVASCATRPCLLCWHRVPDISACCGLQVEHFFAPEAAFEEEERLRKEREERQAADAAAADPPAEVGAAWGRVGELAGLETTAMLLLGLPAAGCNAGHVVVSAAIHLRQLYGNCWAIRG